MGKILIGKIIKPFGIKGEVKVDFYIDNLNDLKNFATYFIQNKSSSDGFIKVSFTDRPYHLEKTPNGWRGTLRLDIISDRNVAEIYRNTDLFIDEQQLPRLEQDVFYIRDIEGAEVFQGEKLIGRIYSVIEIANEFMLIITAPNKRNFVIPFRKKYLESVDITSKKIKLKSIEEFIE